MVIKLCKNVLIFVPKVYIIWGAENTSQESGKTKVKTNTIHSPFYLKLNSILGAMISIYTYSAYILMYICS